MDLISTQVLTHSLVHAIICTYRPEMSLNSSLSLYYYVALMQITGSSAIAAVNFGENNAVGVKFTSNDTEYGFVAKDATLVRTGLESAISKNESVGKLISQYRTTGQLKAV